MASKIPRHMAYFSVEFGLQVRCRRETWGRERGRRGESGEAERGGVQTERQRDRETERQRSTRVRARRHKGTQERALAKLARGARDP